jgi:ABC-type bacteriocin/lantibiotic exporter with double-glycine peptidase domain
MAAVILATGAAERCLACLAMVGRFHGRGVDLNGLRQRFAPATPPGRRPDRLRTQ